jgi:hypothetical protein
VLSQKSLVTKVVGLGRCTTLPKMGSRYGFKIVDLKCTLCTHNSKLNLIG